MLNESGIDWNSLKVGDKVIITGNVAKDAEKRLLMQKLEGPGSVVIWEGMVRRKTAATAR